MAGGLPSGVVDQPFDAQFLKGPVWRLIDPQAAAAAVTAAKVFGVQLIVARLDPVQDLSPFGFRRVETLVTYEGALDPQTAELEGVRRGEPSDAGACADIAVQVFTHDRWHADPQIPNAAADAFKRAWVENDVRGRADTVLIAEGAGGGVDGFVLALERERTAIVDLIAVSPRAQGRGVGRRLLRALAAECGQRRRFGRAGTQETNLAAARLYESAGWRVADRQIGWHWTPEG
ncbi:MAG: GNAT family N-acetyltransferase [Marivibrio sp.]|uniref:GNAT family N-acetyltransferase n=1 Tax=Marivibrio sp. TaxID=2039719 RepID=UPI0032EE4CBF